MLSLRTHKRNRNKNNASQEVASLFKPRKSLLILLALVISFQSLGLRCPRRRPLVHLWQRRSRRAGPALTPTPPLSAARWSDLVGPEAAAASEVYTGRRPSPRWAPTWAAAAADRTTAAAGGHSFRRPRLAWSRR